MDLHADDRLVFHNPAFANFWRTGHIITNNHRSGNVFEILRCSLGIVPSENQVTGTLETAALRSAGVTGSLKEASQFDPGLCPWKPVSAIEEETDLYIYPGFTFRAVDVMLTNFHLPKSTLLMLVSAFAGVDLIREAYQVAIAQRYRFYSFGDAMLIV